MGAQSAPSGWDRDNRLGNCPPCPPISDVPDREFTRQKTGKSNLCVLVRKLSENCCVVFLGGLQAFCTTLTIMIFTLKWYVRNMSHQGKPWKKMTAFLSEWFVWPTAESITNILLPKISTIKPLKRKFHPPLSRFYISNWPLFWMKSIYYLPLDRENSNLLTHQNLCLK